MATETTSTLTNESRTFYEGILLKRLLARLVALQDGQKGTVPKQGGATVQWRRFGALAASTTPLTEGTTPAGKNLSVSTVSGTLAQYGDYVIGSDLVDLVSIDPVIANASELLGEQAGLSVDTVVMNVLAGGTNVRYANGRASRVTVAAGDVINSAEIKKAVRALRAANVPTFPDGTYHAIVHANTEYDILGDTTLVNVASYGGGVSTQQGLDILKGEFLRAWGVTFKRTTQAPVFSAAGAAGIDVYGMLIYGPEAYGVKDLATQTVGEPNEETQQGAASIIFKPLGSAGSADPLEQRWSCGWKVGFVSKILNDSRIVRVEHAVSS